MYGVVFSLALISHAYFISCALQLVSACSTAHNTHTHTHTAPHKIHSHSTSCFCYISFDALTLSLSLSIRPKNKINMLLLCVLCRGIIVIQKWILALRTGLRIYNYTHPKTPYVPHSAPCRFGWENCN